ncbi:hypothetical protein [Ancylobacter pratisalsi]|uniref:ArsR family transcriptional regulator n=1 Tax=Ancylobacter pratisalsi TaxID=1745854 RepID=A0A6P1YPV1_9HYPH|nr:hypothetical protein [Ancylobacter pratisalsi]QIB34761.1 hypothetical protein G3A50_14375 [Ancylobacter pratisalsi]
MSMDKLIREEARLIILKALADQPDETLNSNLLVGVLASFGINRERAWVHGELSYLAEMGALRVTEAGTVRIATLTELGGRHVNRHIAIEGVKRPSRVDA